MQTRTAINVKYWIASDQGRNFTDLEGIDEFRRDLAAGCPTHRVLCDVWVSPPQECVEITPTRNVRE